MSDRSTTRGRNWRRLAAIAGLALLVVAVLVGRGLWLYTEYLYRTSYESGYGYDLAINTNESLENVTLYLPVPVADGRPDLGAAIVREGSAVEGNFSYRVVETRYGPMLRVTADQVNVTPQYYEFVGRDGRVERVEIPESEYDPSNPNMTRDANAGTLVSVTVPADASVATADPWGVEPLFSPRTNRRPVACDFPVGDWLQCYAYDTRVYASYGTNATTSVNVQTTVEGQNAWWVFGWNYDYYRDTVAVELRGAQDGWTNATGTVEVDTERRNPPAGAGDRRRSVDR